MLIKSKIFLSFNLRNKITLDLTTTCENVIAYISHAQYLKIAYTIHLTNSQH